MTASDGNFPIATARTGENAVARELSRIMPSLDDAFGPLVATLNEHLGAPGGNFDDLAPFEGILAVLLERDLGPARWRAALDGLDQADLSHPERLAAADLPEIADALRERGVSASLKSIAPLKHLARWLVGHGGSDILAGARREPGTSRATFGGVADQLAAVKGIGQAGADAVALFALGQPTYPVDRATCRVLVRHGWLDATATYDEARNLVVERAIDFADHGAERAVRVLGDLSRAMGELGRRFCRAAAPRCDGCPLAYLLPEGGPREPDA